jgi:microcystin-dependent protein
MKRRGAIIVALTLLASTFGGKAVAGCGTDAFIGSICIVGFNFCPRGYAEADGRLLPISSYNALFSLLGTTYGGDGRANFALPDLRGRVMIGNGQGPGLSSIRQGQRGGAESVTLTQAQLPAHSHSGHVNATSANGNADSPSGAVPARLPRNRVYNSSADGTQMAADSVTVGGGGGGQATPIRDPYLAVKVCIAIQGLYPSRN